MFKITAADTNITGGSLAISWCVDMELLKLLSEQNIKDPMVVIVTAPSTTESYHESKEARQVVPLKDLLAYVTFKTAGPQRVWAFISWLGEVGAKNKYLSRVEGMWSTDILSVDGQRFNDRINLSSQGDQSDPLDVEVPANFFAPQPAKWERAWVNAFFEGKAVDQCNFRRRRLFAYTVQPVIMGISFLVRSVLFLIALLGFGARSAHPKYVFHLLTYNFPHVLSVMTLDKGSYFVRKMKHTNDDNYAWFLLRKYCLLPFMPVISVPIFLMLQHHILLKVCAIFFSAIVFITFVAFFASGTAKDAFNGIIDWFNRQSNDGPAWYLNKEEAELILCNKDNQNRTLASLPSKKKTLKLRYLDLKSKVCKPFSA